MARWLVTFTTTLGVETRRFARDRAALASALLLPVLMAALLSLALGGDGSGFHATFAVVDEDHGPVASAFVDKALGSRTVQDVVEVQSAASQAEARRLLDADEAAAAVVLPAGLSSGATASGGPPIEVLRSDGEPIAGDLAALLVEQFEIRSQATALAIARTGAPPTEPWPLEVAVTAPDGAPLDGATQYGPVVGVFFVLATLGLAAHRMVADRQRGLVERLAAAPITPSAVLAGRAATALLVGGASLVTLAVTLQLVFGRSWGPALPVATVALALVVALTGLAAVVALVSRTPGQAQTLSIGLAFVFLLAGGSFGPASRPSFAGLVPTTHAIDAFALLATEGAGIATVAPAIAVLGGFGAAGLTLAWALDRTIGWRFG